MADLFDPLQRQRPLTLGVFRMDPHEEPCGAFLRPDGSACWRLWAPRTKSVELVLFDAAGRPEVVAMRPEAPGYFAHVACDVREGQRYAFRLDGGPDRPDPASRWQPDGVHQPSALFCRERFQWSEGGWGGGRRADLVIYELHVGTFTDAGTFDRIHARLDALHELGVTAIELMPVAQFPG